MATPHETPADGGIGGGSKDQMSVRSDTSVVEIGSSDGGPNSGGGAT